MGLQRRPGGYHERRYERGRSQEQLNAIEYLSQVVCPLLYIAAGPRLTLGGKEGFRARISPNCQNNLEIRLDMFLTSLGGELVLQRRVQESPGRDTE